MCALGEKEQENKNVFYYVVLCIRPPISAKFDSRDSCVDTRNYVASINIYFAISALRPPLAAARQSRKTDF